MPCGNTTMKGLEIFTKKESDWQKEGSKNTFKIKPSNKIIIKNLAKQYLLRTTFTFTLYYKSTFTLLSIWFINVYILFIMISSQKWILVICMSWLCAVFNAVWHFDIYYDYYQLAIHKEFQLICPRMYKTGGNCFELAHSVL